MDRDYESLNLLLAEAASRLDRAAIIRDLNFSPEANRRKIGEASADLFEIHHQVFCDPARPET